jgi:nitrite reductase/ring-hydroxylating ferredoxin subunit
MNENRRRFLHVVGATAASLAVPACSSAVDSEPHANASSAATGAGGAGAGGAGAGGAGGGAGGCADPAGINVGTPSSFASDGLHKVPNTVVLIGRDAGGVFALSSLCTHAKCNMNKLGTAGANGVHCSCHGSSFDVNGNVTAGIAPKPLPHFAVGLGCDGTLRVDTATTVPADTRLEA